MELVKYPDGLSLYII